MCKYIEGDEEKDYMIKIKILHVRNEEMIAEFNFNASSLKKRKGSEIPDNLEGDWLMELNIESSDCYQIRKKESYVYFSTSLGTANTRFRLKYSSEIDEMIVKLREIYGLLN